MPYTVRLSMCMYTLIILAFMVNTDPVVTQNWFFNGTDQGVIIYDDLESCVQDLTEQSYVDGVYDVTYDMINALDFTFDWVIAGCVHREEGVHATIHPTYDYGVPEVLDDVIIDELKLSMYRATDL
jgi:hypothetical protein